MIYDFKIDSINENSPIMYICENIGRNQRVLDVGCATGYLGEFLKNNFNVEVVGIDYQDYHINEARKKNIYSDLINLDLNLLETELDRYTSYFDRIILADVLEHLLDPMAVLRKLSKLLKSDGKFLIDIPNVAHASIKYNLLKNNFNYTPMGLLDNTHIRFFTLKSIINGLSQNNFLIENIEYIFYDPGQFNDQPVDYTKYPKEIIDYIEDDIKSSIYQIFIVFEKSDLNIDSILKHNLTFEEIDLIAKKKEYIPKNTNNPIKTLEETIKDKERNLQKKDIDIFNLVVKLQEKEDDTLNLLVKLQENENNIVNLERKTKKQDDSIIKLNNNIKAKTDSINEMKGSNSWKITKPLRNLIYALKKLKIKNVSSKKQSNVKNNNKNYNLSEDLDADLIKSLYIENSNSSVDSYVKKSDRFYIKERDDPKLIAFYLPQFHAIKENDEWWGKGFTEWINVTRAVPQIKGQYQPHLPDELGFYDLSNNDIFYKQIELAKKYGISGFCFHYYWFSGKRLLEKPIFNYLEDKELDFPFMLCWANEPWTRRWDGSEDDILMPQNFTAEDHLKFIEGIMPFFKDERYIKVDNCPMLIIYRPQYFPKEELNAAIELWRDYVKQNGFKDLHLVNAESQDFNSDNKYDKFDASVQFYSYKMQKSWIKDENVIVLNPEFTGSVYDLKSFVKGKTYLKDHDYTLYKTVGPSWDNTARSMSNAKILSNSSPELYQEWLENVIRHTKKRYSTDNQFVFLHSWNEWAEGAHLEPDRKYGFAYLEATLNALKNQKK